MHRDNVDRHCRPGSLHEYARSFIKYDRKKASQVTEEGDRHDATECVTSDGNKTDVDNTATASTSRPYIDDVMKTTSSDSYSKLSRRYFSPTSFPWQIF